MVVQVIELGDGRSPLNTLGAATRQKLHQDLENATRDPNTTSIVLVGSGGKHFSAGADLTEFNKFDETVISLPDLCNYMESLDIPIVAAMNGVALGGGCEVALSCHYRVCCPTSKMGLPEVTVGVIPGAGATQRLPRCIGIQNALDIILSAKPVNAKKALQLKLVNAISHPDQSFLECAKSWASWAELLPIPRLSEVPVKESPGEVQQICSAAQKRLPSVEKGGEGVHAALEAVRASTLPFQEGMEVEAQLFMKTLAGQQGRARRHAFFAVRRAGGSTANKKKSILQSDVASAALLSKNKTNMQVGVIGAGTMGSGIALVLLQAGFGKVWLVDVQPAALEKGIKYMHKTLESFVAKKKLSAKQCAVLKQRLQGTTDIASLKNCQLVVEAVVEDMKIKQQIFEQLDKVVQPADALLLSNTSTLDVSKMAQSLSPPRRQYCAGWHFFSPAHVMKLVEIVVAETTSEDTVGILQALTKQIGKIGVVVGNCDGFVGNRMLNPYTSEMVMLLTEGNNSVHSIDAALVKFGMAIGPFQMSDLAGNDIGYFIRKERGLVRDPKTGIVGPNRTPDMRYTELADDLVTQLGRIGQKALKGWYTYDLRVGKGRMPLPSTDVAEFISNYVVDAKPALSSNEIVERVLFPLVNEGFKILEEGIAQKPSDIDVVYLYGYGWPIWRGGPMFWADNEIGLPRLLERLNEFHNRFPGSAYYVPSKLLETCVAMNLTVEEYYNKGLHKGASYSRL